MKEDRKNRKRIVVTAAIVVLLALLIFGGVSCKKEIQETGVDPVYGEYIQIEDAKLNTYALLMPRTLIAHDAQLRRPITEQEMLEIFENQGLKPVGVRFASGELHGYLGFRNNSATFQEGMDYFWEAQTKSIKKTHENSIEYLEKVKSDPTATEEAIQAEMRDFKKTEKYYQDALDHEYTFEAVLFDAPAATAKNFRKNNKDIVLFIHSKNIE